jgi:hypothetical protein
VGDWVLLIPLEFGVVVVVFGVSGSLFPEAVHVELADEGGEVGVLEVYGQNQIGKVLDIVNDEADSVMVPFYNFGEVGVLNSGAGGTWSMS